MIRHGTADSYCITDIAAYFVGYLQYKNRGSVAGLAVFSQILVSSLRLRLHTMQPLEVPSRADA